MHTVLTLTDSQLCELGEVVAKAYQPLKAPRLLDETLGYKVNHYPEEFTSTIDKIIEKFYQKLANPPRKRIKKSIPKPAFKGRKTSV